MQLRDIKVIGVAGTGLMGGDTAAVCLGNGYRVIMMGINEEECEKGRQNVRADFDELVKNGLLSQEQADRALSRLDVRVGFEHGRDCDYIFEAVLERVDVKGSVFQQLEAVCGRDTVFASITSGISADALADTVEHSDRLLVAHFWNPAHLIPLVEVVRSRYTSAAAVQLTVDLLGSLHKEIVVLDKNIPGFIGNRLMHAMYREALYLVENGVCSPEDIDRTVYYSFGQRFASVGLLEYYESVGLDLQHNVQSYLLDDLCNEGGPQKILKEHYEKGELGPKTGSGIFDWTKKDMADFRHRKNSPFFKMFNWEESREN